MSADATATVSVDGLVHAIKEAWRAGEPPDVVAVLRDHPDLLRHRSFVIDLAYEEYCLRDEAGNPPDPDRFCQSLPAYRSQLREVIWGHRQLADHPELLSPAIHW